MAKDDRARNWTVVVYPESAPTNWRDVLDELHIPWIESPLHDCDVDANGEVKKEHWHIALVFEGKKSFEQVKEVSDALNAPVPQKVASIRSLVRYFAHLDNPDKHQYEIQKIIAHGGADIDSALLPTRAARYALIAEMIAYVRDANVCEFKDLAYFAMAERPDDWFPLLCDSAAYVVGAVIKSNRHSQVMGYGAEAPSQQ